MNKFNLTVSQKFTSYTPLKNKKGHLHNPRGNRRFRISILLLMVGILSQKIKEHSALYNESFEKIANIAGDQIGGNLQESSYDEKNKVYVSCD